MRLNLLISNLFLPFCVCFKSEAQERDWEDEEAKKKVTVCIIKEHCSNRLQSDFRRRIRWLCVLAICHARGGEWLTLRFEWIIRFLTKSRAAARKKRIHYNERLGVSEQIASIWDISASQQFEVSFHGLRAIVENITHFPLFGWVRHGKKRKRNKSESENSDSGRVTNVSGYESSLKLYAL